MKHILITLQIQNGEYRYEIPLVRQTKCKSLDFAATWEASHFYGKYSYKMDEAWYFHGGEVAVSVKGIRELSKDHYDILKQYL